MKEKHEQRQQLYKFKILINCQKLCKSNQSDITSMTNMLLYAQTRLLITLYFFIIFFEKSSTMGSNKRTLHLKVTKSINRAASIKWGC